MLKVTFPPSNPVTYNLYSPLSSDNEYVSLGLNRLQFFPSKITIAPG